LKDILSEVRDQLLDEVKDVDGITVEAVRLGLGYSGLKLDTGHVGVCNSMLSEAALDCCEVLLDAGTMAGRPVTEFLGFLESWDFIERVMGVSALNALSQIVFEKDPDRYLVEERNLVDVVEVHPDDTVVMVGHIKPFTPSSRPRPMRCTYWRGVPKEVKTCSQTRRARSWYPRPT